MRINFNELQKLKPIALKSRVLVQSEYDELKGTKPRAEEETMALTILTINRVNKAIREGRWILKGDRRIEFRSC